MRGKRRSLRHMQWRSLWTLAPWQCQNSLMTSLVNRRFVLAARPEGLPRDSDFALEEVPLRKLDEGLEEGLDEGQVLVRSIYLAVDPGMRPRLDPVRSYAPPIAIGGLIEGAGVGQVLASRHPGFKPGDHVTGALGWQTHVVSSGRVLMRIPRSNLPLTAWLGPLGIPGMTAYFGVHEVGAARAGETVLVSSAAGTVGTFAGQVAGMLGCRTVGVAGSAAKCEYVREMGFDAAIDYKAAADLGAAIDEACPDGVDVYFDNVGGAMLDVVLTRMRRGGRVVISGAVADYNLAPEDRPGVKQTLLFITRRLRMEGFVVLDYRARFPEAIQAMSEGMAAGRIRYRERILEGKSGDNGDDGLARLPGAFIDLFRGQGLGRRLVRVGPAPGAVVPPSAPEI